jgi:oligopeptide/dipeptide ABC transporter ATP-binding protein
MRRNLQLMFQDPYASLNPRMRVGALIKEPLQIQRVGTRSARTARVQELLGLVGLARTAVKQYPHEFSGGQRQRIGLARALALQPQVLVADEPVSALDVSIQAQVLNLLTDLQQEFGLTYVFITHDLAIVRHFSQRVAVMYLGKVVEVARTDDIFEITRHPYTKALLSALPVPDPDAADSRERIVLTGDLPSPINPPSGCRFHPRCPKAQEICSREEPPLLPVLGDEGTHLTACHFPLEVGESLRPRAEASGPERRIPR